MSILSGVYQKTLFRNEKNGYTVFSFRTKDYDEYKNDKGELICCGYIPIYTCNMPLELNGEPKEGKSGYTFSVSSSRLLINQRDVAIQFLTSEHFKGVGPKLAEKILSVTGLDLFSFANQPDAALSLCNGVSGLGQEKANSVIQTLQRATQQHAVFSYLHPFGGTLMQSIKICECFSVDALERFQEDCYFVGMKANMPFSMCDNIAKSLGRTAYDEKRLESLVSYALYEISNSGHTYATLKELRTNVAYLVKQSAFHEHISDALLIRACYSSPRIVVEQLEKDIRFYTKQNWKDERAIVHHLNRIQQSSVPLSYIAVDELIEKTEMQCNIQYSKSQRATFEFLQTSGLKILTGGPGTGKTTVINGLIAAYRSMFPDNEIALCAPTGRAAQRMEESTGFPALTIHRLLDIRPFNDDYTYRDQSNPITADFLIVDEMSMADSSVFAMLAGAIKNGSLVVLSGDVDQLPSVGPGKVLLDLIASNKFETIALDVVYRQSACSPIVSNALKINHGNPNLDNCLDFRIFSVKTEEELCAKLSNLVSSRTNVDIQILSSTKKGLVGIDSLNRVLQDIYNPCEDGITYGSTQYRIGDKVIMMHNNYDVGYVNGDVGIILDINDDAVVVNLGNEDIVVRRSLRGDMSLAYALTIHKSQGSEYDIVVVALPSQPANMLKRNLLYTAVTRAKQYVVIIEQSGALEQAIRHQDSIMRHTSLKEKLCGAFVITFNA